MSNEAQPPFNWRVVFNRANPPGFRGWGRVRAAQFAELGRAVRAAAWGQSVNALILTVVLWNSVATFELMLWLASIAGMMIAAWLPLRRYANRSVQSMSRRAIDQAAYYAMIFAAIWSIPAILFFTQASHAEQLAICLVTTALMAGAAFMFGNIPSVACAYALPLGAAFTNMLYGLGSPILSVLSPVYCAGLVIVVYSTGRAFMQRKCLDIELGERADTISLLLRDYEDSDADWLWQTNANHAFQNVSTRFARVFDRSPDDLEGCSILDLLDDLSSKNESAYEARSVTGLIQSHAPFSEISVPIGDDARHRCIELSARPRFSTNGRFLGYRGVGSDVTDARQAANRIAHMARHDALTSLPNRLYLMEALDAALAKARENHCRCAVLLLDLDRFKSVNDSLGHVAGDHLLRQVAARFSPWLLPGMVAGRLGGDEFAIIVSEAPDDAALAARCEQLVEAIKLPFVYNDQHLFVGASIGIAIGLRDGTSVEELVRNADLALYRAKGSGGNVLCFYEPGLHAQAEERRQIELAMRSALDRGEFSLAFQPVIRSSDRSVKGFEALMRWTNPSLGSLSPAKFIPIAEETGLIRRLGEWALRTACAEAANWPDEIGLAVNISPLQLRETNFILTLVSALSQSGLSPQRLELEITETVFLQITAATHKILEQIKSLGVRLAIDDFGTGYASLGYLRDTRFDTLKIDRSFVEGVRCDDPESGAIIKAIVALAGNLGMSTVAEGVETPEQLAMIEELGCNAIQGFIFSNAIPAANVADLLEARGNRAAA